MIDLSLKMLAFDIPAKNEIKYARNRKIKPEEVPNLVAMMKSNDAADIRLAWAIIKNLKRDKTFHEIIKQITNGNIDRSYRGGSYWSLPADGSWIKTKRVHSKKNDPYNYNKFRIVKRIG